MWLTRLNWPFGMSDNQPLLSGHQTSSRPVAQAYGPPPPPQDVSAYQGPPPSYQQQLPPAQNYQDDYRGPVASAPPQQQPYSHQPYQPTQTVVFNNNITFGETPMQLRCPNCQRDVITSVRYEMGLLTWISVGVLFLIGGILCFWIPLLMDSLKDVVHVCPNCRYTCGVYKRMNL